jgi:SAM-dependent methyltransferase
LKGPAREADPPDLYWLIGYSWIAHAAYVAVRLDVADRLRAGPMSAGELAMQCGVKERPLLQVLRALAGFGVFARDDAGRFALNAPAEELLRDSRSPVRAYARLWGEQLYPAGGKMLDQVRTGTPAFELQLGQPIWELYGSHPREAAAFDGFMSAATQAHSGFIVDAYDFGRHTRVVDVGGQRGTLLAAILERHPSLQGVWYDRPEQLPAARGRLAGGGLSERCELLTGSFLDRVPGQGDLYLLKHVLHDRTDEDAETILANIARAMAPGASLLVIEAVLAAGPNVDRRCALRDLEQMVWTGGTLRTRAELEALLRRAGLQLVGVTPTPVPDLCLIEARCSA